MPTAVTSPLGSPVPATLPHAISVSLPTWQDNVDYEEGAPRVLDVMKTGYPRFFIHRSIQKLASVCEKKFCNGTSNKEEKCMVFASHNFALACRDFMTRMDPSVTSVRIVQFFINPSSTGANATIEKMRSGNLHVAIVPATAWPHAKAFWQHTGTGISSRHAEHCLLLLEQQQKQNAVTEAASSPYPPSQVLESKEAPKVPLRGRNKHYFSRSISYVAPILAAVGLGSNAPRKNSAAANGQEEEGDGSEYLEERYARNLPPSATEDAKRTLRRRIAGVLRQDQNPEVAICSKKEDEELAPSSRGVGNITEDDVFLFPGGMCAIWHSHQLLLQVLGADKKSVCWGFPYVDTLKILEKWGPGCHFFGNGTEFDELETLLQSTPILALFCEVTSNPLLKTPDLARLRALANKYGFALVVDETIGNYFNVEVLPYSDIVCSSLTKVFSGETNVMGGGLILNPQGQFYNKLKPALKGIYEDVYWDEDAIFLERNSRDFQQRVAAINRNAEMICDLLHSHSLEAKGQVSSNATDVCAIKKIYYPKLITTSLYDALKTPSGGYGGLLSITFTSNVAAKAFFDGLGCEKGPSLGTNFTLACPFVILAHYTELDWVQKFGIDPYLVRISVGLEERSLLEGWVMGALRNAEEAVRNEKDGK